uniref:Uncharacterized protein n=1 Tax=Plectus sambesii TaxID=2011161 RepID=A0A914WGM7_9BILA
MERADFGADNSTGLFAGPDGHSNDTVAAFDWRSMRDVPLHVLAIVSCVSLFLALVLLLVTLRLCCCVMLRLRRRRRVSKTLHSSHPGQKSASSGRSGAAPARRGLFGRMIARLDEFDSLTPLIVTPGSMGDDEPGRLRPSSSLSSSRSTKPPNLTSASPPPPRRVSAGKTTIVPLTSIKGRNQRPPILAGTPDSRGTTFEMSTTTRSFGTIPEDTEDSQSTVILPSPMSLEPGRKGVFTELDLISIDRTSISTANDRRSGTNGQARLARNSVGLAGSAAAPTYQVPAPCYRPPPPPSDVVVTAGGISVALSREHDEPSTAATAAVGGLQSSMARRPASLNNTTNNSTNNNYISRISPTMPSPSGFKTCLRFDPQRAQVHQTGSGGSKPKKSPSGESISSNLSSPIESSIGDSGSPLDTTGSIAELSDSFYMASESDTGSDARGRCYYTDSGMQQKMTSGGSAASSEPDLSALDTDQTNQKRYQLHRIEEESEHDDPGVHLPLSKTNESLGSALSHVCSSNVDSQSNLLMPRSISEQFEHMEREKMRLEHEQKQSFR